MCRSQSLSTTLHDVAWLPDSVYPCLHCHVGKDLELDVVTGVHHESSAIQILFVSVLWGVFIFRFFSWKTKFVPYNGPYLASYRDIMFLQRPQSFRNSATCSRNAAFSLSRNEARTVIWFSFSRRASRERLAATLFFFLLDQYLSSCGRQRILIQNNRISVVETSLIPDKPPYFMAYYSLINFAGVT